MMKTKQTFTTKFLLRKVCVICCLLSFILLNSACSDEDELTNEKPSITVLMGFNGKGNNDYAALIYKAVEKWENNPNVKMTVYYPKTNEEAIDLYQNWAKQSAHKGRSLMLAANGQFEHMVKNVKLDLTENQQVLALEFVMDHPAKGVHSFEISRSGVSFLSGKLASKCDEALVIIGHRTKMLDDAEKLFHKGFGNEKQGYEAVELSRQFDGFNMPEKAKELASKHLDSFIMPLAGLSNDGVYELLNECEAEDKMIAAGMDVDCNALSKRIPFSYIVNIDKAIDYHLQCWLVNKSWPNENFGLKNGMTSIVFNPDYTEVGGITKQDFESLYQDFFEEACAYDQK